MLRPALPALGLAVLLGPGCRSYEPEPVDLAAHLQAFAARLELPPPPPLRDGQDLGRLDPSDGIDRTEAQLLAAVFHPDCRLARQRAGITEAVRDEAGRWVDPALNLYTAKFLDGVPYEWLVQAQIAFTIPLSGRFGHERELAAAQHATALVTARLTENGAMHRTCGAWARWQAAVRQRDGLQRLGAELQALEAIVGRLAAAGERTQQEARAFTLERLLRAAELVQAEHDVATAELELKRAIGLHPAAAVRFVPDGPPPLLVEDPAARQRLLLDGPQLALLQLQHAETERALALEVAKQWPDLWLAPGFHEEEREQAVPLGLVLPLPLWNANIQAIRRAEAQRAAAAEALRGAAELALHDLAGAERRLLAAAQQRALVDGELVPLARQQVADGRRLAELGQLEPLLILDALVRAHGAGMQAIAAELAAAEATVAVNSLFWNEPPAIAGPAEPR
ncbi:MAG: TolC family protein [Planctomycetes bacterium]|nr:TolC family protein [Planctomycetota bacterium]